MSEERQKNQEQLAFGFVGGSECPSDEKKGTEAPMAKRETEDRAGSQRMMKEVCKRENRREALQRVRANQGSPGIDGMTVDAVPEYLEQHGPTRREQLLSGTYEPKPVKRVEIPKPDGGVGKLGIPTVFGPVGSADGAAGIAEAVGPDVFRRQLWIPTGTVRQTGSGTGAAVYRQG
jgi:RNA-directed DNA polymerase